MPIVIDNEHYLTASEAIKELGVARQTFYTNYKPLLKAHQVGQLKHPRYRRSDVLKLKQVRPIEETNQAPQC